MTQKSELQLYTEAFDRGDFKALGKILEQVYQTGDIGLEAAIDFVHLRFDTNEPLTTQLIRLRDERQA